MELYEKMVESEEKYRGIIVNVRLDKAQLVNGKLAGREVVEHPGGVCVLPYHEDGTVTVVRQYRYPAQKVVTELPAGKLDKGEHHRSCGLRELEEEVGMVPTEFIYMGSIYTSPGYCDELLHMYLATGLSQGNCHPDEDEFLEIDRIPFADLVEQVMAGEIIDAKTVALVLKTKLYLGL